MHADISPNLLEVGPNETCSLTVRITNTMDTIDAYEVSLFGLDPTWVTVDPPRLSLFPTEAGDVQITVALPPMFPAGHRQLTVHVRSENDPTSFALTPLGLVALGQQRMSIRVDPVLITGGKDATFGVVVSNDGNTTINGIVTATDPEELLAINLRPADVELPPGHQEVVQAHVAGKRPWVGQPKVRAVTFTVDSTTQVQAMGTFLQKPRISRWLLSLMGLLLAAAIFAVVLSRTFDNVVKQSSVDKSLLSSALDKGGAGGQTVAVKPGIVTGKVVLFSTRKGVAGIQAQLFGADDVKNPIASAATADGGAYSFGQLNAGNYKIKFSGAGFNDLWYEAGNTAADATPVAVELGKTVSLNDVELGGRPGKVKGTVQAADLTTITATLVVPGTTTDPTAAQVRSVAVSADGTFLFENVPSPADYQLVISKPGYATETRDIELGAAQTVDGIAIVLKKGDGTIHGHIKNAGGFLGGATVEATDGINKIPTVSLTDGDIGFFAVRSLNTPQKYTLTISRDGYTTETRTVTLATAQDFDVGDVVLQRSTGSIAGTVTQTGSGPGGSAAGVGGVAVTISAGPLTITTFTASTGNVGAYFVDNLPVPATYTVSFAKTGLVGQVRVQDLDPSNGTADVPAPGVPPVDVELVASTATIKGVVRDVTGTPVAGASVKLTDGTNTRTFTTADDPLGRFEFSGVAPGAYTLDANLTGSTDAVLLINVKANDVVDKDIKLDKQASAKGQVFLRNQTTKLYEVYPNAVVRIFLTGSFPGPASSAVDTKITDMNGQYEFDALVAPQNYVIAVYQSLSSPDPLDSQLILTQPSTEFPVPPFQIPVLF